MTGDQSSPLGTGQKLVLLLVALGLAAGLLLLRGGLNPEAPLDALARRSLQPEVALSNGRPTMIEFYADWCSACREMAPTMLTVEQRTEKKLNIVLVNVDNPRWQDLIDRYDVNGIPQLNLFNAEGELLGRSLGVRTSEQLNQLTDALINNQPLPKFAGMGTVSELVAPETNPETITGGNPGKNAGTNSANIDKPRSHGQAA